MREVVSSTLPPVAFSGSTASAVIRFKEILHRFCMLGHSRGCLIMNKHQNFKYWLITQLLCFKILKNDSKFKLYCTCLNYRSYWSKTNSGAGKQRDSLSRSLMAEGGVSQVMDEGGFWHFAVTASLSPNYMATAHGGGQGCCSG